MFFLKKRYLGVLPSELPWGNLHPSQQTTKPQTSNDGACRQGWQGQNTGPSLAAVEKYQTNERGSSMTDNQLAQLEARIEADHRAEQARRMEQAMKAVNEVSASMHYRTGRTYGIVRNKQIKANTGIWPESMQPCKDG